MFEALLQAKPPYGRSIWGLFLLNKQLQRRYKIGDFLGSFAKPCYRLYNCSQIFGMVEQAFACVGRKRIGVLFGFHLTSQGKYGNQLLFIGVQMIGIVEQAFMRNLLCDQEEGITRKRSWILFWPHVTSQGDYGNQITCIDTPYFKVVTYAYKLHQGEEQLQRQDSKRKEVL